MQLYYKTVSSHACYCKKLLYGHHAMAPCNLANLVHTCVTSLHAQARLILCIYTCHCHSDCVYGIECFMYVFVCVLFL